MDDEIAKRRKICGALIGMSCVVGVVSWHSQLIQQYWIETIVLVFGAAAMLPWVGWLSEKDIVKKWFATLALLAFAIFAFRNQMESVAILSIALFAAILIAPRMRRLVHLVYYFGNSIRAAKYKDLEVELEGAARPAMNRSLIASVAKVMSHEAMGVFYNIAERHPVTYLINARMWEKLSAKELSDQVMRRLDQIPKTEKRNVDLQKRIEKEKPASGTMGAKFFDTVRELRELGLIHHDQTRLQDSTEVFLSAFGVQLREELNNSSEHERRWEKVRLELYELSIKSKVQSTIAAKTKP